MPPHESPRSFQATRWSLVRAAAGRGDAAAAGRALAEICEICWYPIYAFIRRAGHPAHDAEDLTQSFFARLIEKDILSAADPTRGRLRPFLLTCVRNHLHHEHERNTAAKRDVRLLTNFDAAAQKTATRASPQTISLPTVSISGAGRSRSSAPPSICWSRSFTPQTKARCLMHCARSLALA